MAVTFVATATATPVGGSASSISMAMPAGHATNDLLFIWVLSFSAKPLNTPAGWTSAGAPTVNNARAYLFRKLAASSSEPNVTVSITSGSGWLEGFTACYRGVDTATPVEAGPTILETPSSAGIPLPAITTVNANALIAYFGFTGGAGGTLAAPAGTTSRLITAMQNIARHGLADILKAAAGTQAATSFTGSGAGQDEGVAVALKAAVTAVTPVADFTGTPLSGAYTLSVAFTDSSTNTPTSWAWTFGDGGTSSSQNPSHSYTAAGTYTVALVATNAAGSNTKTRTGYVVVSAPVTAPVAAFSAAPLSGDRPLTVAFTDLSS